MEDISSRPGASAVIGDAKPSAKADHLRERIEACLREDYRCIDLGTLAKRLGYSYRQMTRIIRSLYGATFPELLNDRRLEIVRRGLENGLPLKQAVLDAGYASVGYYRRVLRRRQAGE